MTYVQSVAAGNDGSAFTITATLPSAVLAHDTALAFIAWSDNVVPNPVGITDTQGNTWELVSGITNPLSDSTNHEGCALYVCKDMAAASSGMVVTATFSGSSVVAARRIVVWVGRGLSNTDPVVDEVATWNSSASTSADSGNVDPPADGCDIVSFVMPSGAIATPTANGATRRAVTAIGAASEAAVSDNTQTTAATTHGDWTLSASSASLVMTVALSAPLLEALDFTVTRVDDTHASIAWDDSDPSIEDGVTIVRVAGDQTATLDGDGDGPGESGYDPTTITGAVVVAENEVSSPYVDDVSTAGGYTWWINRSAPA